MGSEEGEFDVKGYWKGYEDKRRRRGMDVGWFPTEEAGDHVEVDKELKVGLFAAHGIGMAVAGVGKKATLDGLANRSAVMRKSRL